MVKINCNQPQLALNLRPHVSASGQIRRCRGAGTVTAAQTAGGGSVPSSGSRGPLAGPGPARGPGRVLPLAVASESESAGPPSGPPGPGPLRVSRWQAPSPPAGVGAASGWEPETRSPAASLRQLEGTDSSSVTDSELE